MTTVLIFTIGMVTGALITIILGAIGMDGRQAAQSLREQQLREEIATLAFELNARDEIRRRYESECI